MYQVIACPRCRRAKVVESGRKTTQCASCADALELAHLRAYWTGDDPSEARHAAGLVNAKLAHAGDAFAAALLPQAPPRAKQHEDRYDAAAAAARGVASESARVDRVAKSLREFTREDLARAFERAALPLAKLDAHVRRLVETGAIVEPRAGTYRSA